VDFLQFHNYSAKIKLLLLRHAKKKEKIIVECTYMLPYLFNCIGLDPALHDFFFSNLTKAIYTELFMRDPAVLRSTKDL
jgi:hypothetical protein